MPLPTYAENSAYSKEMRRWNRPRGTFEDGVEGMNAPRYEPFPKMLYKAAQLPTGTVRCMEPPPDPRDYADMKLYERDLILAENFNRQCYRIVKSEAELVQAIKEGWRDSPKEALEYFEACASAIADAAAERAYADQRLSERAQAEMAAAEAETGVHLPEGPPMLRKRGRPAKPVAADPLTE